MKNVIKKIEIMIFIGVLTLPTVIWLVFGAMGFFDFEGDVARLGENRELTKISDDVTLGNITAELEMYYDDRVPFRSAIILGYRKANSKLEYIYQNSIEPRLVELMGQKSSMNNIEVSSDVDINSMYGDSDGEDDIDVADDAEMTPEEKAAELEAKGIHEYKVIDIIKPSYTTYGYVLKRCRNCGIFLKTDFEEKLIDDTYLPPKEGEGRVIKGRNNWLYYAGDNSIAYYTGSNILSEEEMSEWGDMLQELKDACDEKGITLGVMVAPNKEQVYPEYMPSYNVETLNKREDVFELFVRENRDVNYVYPIDELKAGKKYYETHLPFDTHWTQAGAFIATMALYKEMGLETTNINHLEVLPTQFTQRGLIDTGNLDGDMYQGDIDYVIVYKPEITVTWFEGEKSFVMPSNIYRSKSDNPNNKKVTLIGDSFRLAMIPYLSQDFTEVCAAHRNVIDEVKDDLNNTDTLILVSVERFDKYLFNVIPKITEYIKDDIN